MEVVYLTLSRTQVLVSGCEDLESRNRDRGKGSSGKRKRITHSDPSFTTARVYGRQGWEVWRRPAVSGNESGSSSLMGGKMTLRVGTTLGKSPRGSKRRGLFRTGEPEGVSESGEFQRGLLCETFPSRFEFWRNTKL